MMGPRQVAQGALFYEFPIEAHVPPDHLLSAMDRCVDLSEMRRDPAPFYSTAGRPSADPEPMIRMRVVGYAFGIRSEGRLCEAVHPNLAYRWFCRLDLTDPVAVVATALLIRSSRRFKTSGEEIQFTNVY